MVLRRALVVAVLLLTACSGSDEEPPATTTTSSTSTTSSTVDDDPYGAAPVPASGAPLGDGRHAVRIEAVADDQLEVDVVEFLIGAEAEQAAAADGQEASDFYVRNADDEVRTVDVADDVAVRALLDEGPEPDQASFDDVEAGEGRLWFITVAGGEVTEIVEQYLP